MSVYWLLLIISMVNISLDKDVDQVIKFQNVCSGYKLIENGMVLFNKICRSEKLNIGLFSF